MSSERLSLRDWALLVLFALALFLPGLTAIPPVDRDESRYVVASQRMVETGEFVDIRFQDDPRFQQPAGIYWLQSASTALFDPAGHDDIWSYRIPSQLGALAAVLLTTWLGALVFGRKIGLGAGLLLAACFSLNFEARIAKTDAMLLASIVTAQLVLMRAYLEPALKKRVAIIFWAALGVGLMIKGPIILIVAGSTIAALTLWDRKAGWLLRLQPAWGFLITLAIALPWYIAIGLKSDGGFYAFALGDNLAGKIASGQQGHGGPPGYHLALFPVAFWPGSLLALLAIPYAWAERRNPAIRFLICWIVPTWIIYELVRTKLPHYVLPTYPAIALLAAAALFAPAKQAMGRVCKIAAVIVAALWLLASGLLAALGPIALFQVENIVDPFVIIVSTLGFIAAAASLWLLWKQRPFQAIGATAIAGLLIWAPMFGLVVPRLHELWATPRIMEAVNAAQTCPGTLAAFPYHEPSLVFLHGRERTVLTDTSAEAADVLVADRSCGMALIGAAAQADFLARAEALGLPVVPVSEVDGRNYSDGERVNATLYRVHQR